MASITFVGDVFITDECSVSLPYENIVANFESAITGATAAAPAKINLKTTSDQVDRLIGFKPAAVCLANNHVSDFGEAGLADTIKYFDDYGIFHFGAGMNLESAASVCILKIGGHAIGLIGAVCPSTSPVVATSESAGVALIDRERIATAIVRARELGAETIVVNYHWGAEEVAAVKLEDIELGRATIDVGADLVIGHHAHCIQPYERYNGKYIFYGLGNCLFPDFSAESMYSEQRQAFTAVFRKRQEYWNKRSLAVSLDLDSGAIVVDVLQQKDGVTGLKTRGSSKYEKALNTNAFYRRTYRYFFFYYKVRCFFFKFLREPKFPGPKHLKGMLSLLRSDNYK